MVSFISWLGMFALSGGLIGYFTFPMGLKMGIKSSINLAENGMIFPLFMNPPFPTKSEFSLFAIRNPREVLIGNKMEFDIKGPYVYMTYLERENIKFSKEKERVSYDSRRKLYLDESQSADLDEKMWLLNPILPSMLKSIKSMVLDRVPFQRFSERVVFQAVNLLLDNFKERLIMRTTPRNFLQGKTVELLASLTSLAERFGLASLIPPGPPQNKFGLAFAQNETIEQLEIFTGLGKTKERFAEVSRWKDKTEVTAWRGKCRTINGTNGELYKPLIEIGEPIRIFLSPLCRSFLLEPVVVDQQFELQLNNNESGGGGGNKSNAGLEREGRQASQEEMQASEHRKILLSTGIEAFEYEFSPSLYMGARSNPSNRCFCENVRTYDCQYDGLLSMGPCFFEAPIYFSRANFKGVDKRISGTTRFLSSTSEQRKLPEKQNFALDSTTGSVLAVNLTIMGIFKIVRQPYMRDLEKVQNLTYAPVFATTESVELPFEFAWQIYALQRVNQYYKPATMATAMSGLVTLLLKRFLFSGGAGGATVATSAA